MIRTLTHPPTYLEREFTQCINRIASAAVNNQYNKCGWFSTPMAFNPGLADIALSVAAETVDPATIRPQFQFQAGIKTFIQIKNQSSFRADVTMYRVTPKRDLPKTFGALGGANPAWISSSFAAAQALLTSIPVTARLKEFDEHNADLKTPGLISGLSVKRLSRFYLNAGEFKQFRFAKKPTTRSKSQDGLHLTTDTYDSIWVQQKWMGSFVVFRVQGSEVHDEAKVTAALAAAPAITNLDFGSTMSTFNCEFYCQAKMFVHGLGVPTTTHYGVISTILPQIPGAPGLAIAAAGAGVIDPQVPVASNAMVT